MWTERIAWGLLVSSIVALSGCLFASWWQTMRPIVEAVQIEKTYRAWGPLDCPSNWTCEGRQCCVTCVNLATGEPVVRCHSR